MALLEIFWSFRSPYSWLATPRLQAFARDYALEVRFRLVRPLAVREDGFFQRSRPQFLPYLWRDATREAQRLGMVLLPPRPDPIEMDLATGVVAAQQPLIERLNALGLAAEARGAGLDFAAACAARIWGFENWHADESLDQAARAAGASLAALEAWAGENRARIAETLARNEADHARHHWGVPLMALDDEPFFGQDRIDALRWRLDQRGLRRL